MSKLLVTKTPSGLKPTYESDYDIYSKIPLNETFEIDYKKPRNVRFHRKFFSLLKMAFENQSDYPSLERMRKRLIEVAGYYDEYRAPLTKELVKEVHSISFASMDETEFNTLYNAVKYVISQWLGIDDQDINDNLEQYY